VNEINLRKFYKKPCSYCNGTGIVSTQVDWMQDIKTCPICFGSKFEDTAAKENEDGKE
jgi:excinuclease UvrABC ATPase subunit